MFESLISQLGVLSSSTGFPKAQWGARNKREGRELETSEKCVRGMVGRINPNNPQKGDRGDWKRG